MITASKTSTLSMFIGCSLQPCEQLCEAAMLNVNQMLQWLFLIHSQSWRRRRAVWVLQPSSSVWASFCAWWKLGSESTFSPSSQINIFTFSDFTESTSTSIQLSSHVYLLMLGSFGETQILEFDTVNLTGTYNSPANFPQWGWFNMYVKVGKLNKILPYFFNQTQCTCSLCDV